MVSLSLRKSFKASEEKDSLLSGKQRKSSSAPRRKNKGKGKGKGKGYLTPSPKRKKNNSSWNKLRGGAGANATPPMTPEEENDYENDRYDVAVFETEYDPSNTTASRTTKNVNGNGNGNGNMNMVTTLTPPKPVTPYPSTTIGKVAFKPGKMPPAFPPSAHEQRALEPFFDATMVGATAVGSNDPPAANEIDHDHDHDKNNNNTTSLYSQTWKYLDDLCQVPAQSEPDPTVATPEWGTAPSADDLEESYTNNTQTIGTYPTNTIAGGGDDDGGDRTNTGTLARTPTGTHTGTRTSTSSLSYPSQSYMSASSGTYPPYSQPPYYSGTRGKAGMDPEPEAEHENFEVVLDSNLLTTVPEEEGYETSGGGAGTGTGGSNKRSLVKRLFGKPKAEKATSLQNVARGGEPEADIDDDAAVIYPETDDDDDDDDDEDLDDGNYKQSNVQNVDKSFSQTSIPSETPSDPPGEKPEQRPLSPVEEVLNSIGSLFSYYHPREDQDQQQQEQEHPSLEHSRESQSQPQTSRDISSFDFSLANSDGDDDDYLAEGPEDEIEANATPCVSLAGDFSPQSTSAAPAAVAASEQDGTKTKKKKALSLGKLAKKLGLKKKKHKESSSSQDSTPSSPPAGVAALASTASGNAGNQRKRNKPLWKSTVDKKTGRTYWYNRITRESTYNPPPEALQEQKMYEMEKEMEEIRNLSLAAEARKQQEQQQQQQQREEQEQKQKEQERQEQAEREAPSLSLSREENQKMSTKSPVVTQHPAVSQAKSMEGDIPMITKRSMTSSSVAPINATTAPSSSDTTAVSEDKRENLPSTTTSAAAVEDSVVPDDREEKDVAPNASSEEAITPKKNNKKKKPLWKAVEDKNTGRTYYYHRKTRETTWTLPEELKDDTHPPEDVPTLSEKVDSSSQMESAATSKNAAEEDTKIETPEAADDQGEKTETVEESPVVAMDLEKPFDEPIVDVGDIPMISQSSPARMNARTNTFVSKASANTKSTSKTDTTQRIRNTASNSTPQTSSFGTISETFSTATSLSSHHEDGENRLNTPDRVGLLRHRDLKVEDLTSARVAPETYDTSGRVLYGQFNQPGDETDEGSYFGDNEVDAYGEDSVSALSEADNDVSQRKANFEQARRRALDDAIEREDWDLAAALSEGMRANTTTGDFARAHANWNPSDLDKFIADNDWDAVKGYIARMREAKKAGHEEMPPPISQSYSNASDPTVRMATTARSVRSPPTIPESRRELNRPSAQEGDVNSLETDDTGSSDSADSTDMSQSLDEDTFDSEYS